MFESATLKLSQSSVGTILQALYKLPYEVAAPVIRDIEAQLIAEHAPKPPVSPPTTSS